MDHIGNFFQEYLVVVEGRKDCEGSRMYKKTMIVLFIIVTLSSILITAFAFTGNDPSSNQQLTTSIGQNVNNDNKLPGMGDAGYSIVSKNTNTVHKSVLQGLKVPVFISPQNARKIALKYIEEPGASPGKPVLVKEDGKRVYIVPVIEDKKRVGEIHLDARNGKNIGGCGGAPD